MPRRAAIAALTLPLILLPQATPSLACPPTGGYVGSIFSGTVDAEQAMEVLREAGVRASIVNVTFPYLGGVLKLRAVEFVMGRWPDGRPLRAYIIPGRRVTLVLSETSASLDAGWLRLATSILASVGVLDPSTSVVGPLASPNNESPPEAVVRWAELEMSIELGEKILVWKCGGPLGVAPTLPSLWGGVAAVVANEIDANISYPLLRSALEGAGLNTVLLPPERAAEALLRYPIVIFLGGHLAPGTGPAVWPFVDPTAAQELATGETPRLVQVESVSGVTIVVLAGADRWETRGAVEEFISQGWPERLATALACPGGVCVRIVSSSGSCAVGEGIGVAASVEGEYAFVTYREGGPNPCAFHVISSVSVSASSRTVEVTLALERKPVICIQCVGVITTTLQIGPLEPGGWTIVVNGRPVSVVIQS
ncbi:MAG: hypothetical protein QI223_05960 [Candidatus Korarchaeota archaeon]|nr:hypothetical protein [Candidatus Korarchaeota archaeon]